MSRIRLILVILNVTMLAHAQSGWVRIAPPHGGGYSNTFFWSKVSGFVDGWITHDGARSWSRETDNSKAFYTRDGVTHFFGGTDLTITYNGQFPWYDYRAFLESNIDDDYARNLSFDSAVGYCNCTSHLDFYNSSLGWAFLSPRMCGENGSDFAGTPQLLITTDGGHRWRDLLTEPDIRFLLGGDFLNDSLLIGFTSDHIFTLPVYAPDTYVLIEPVVDGDSDYHGSISFIKPIDKDTLLAFFSNNRLIRSVDGGRSWVTVLDSIYGVDIAVSTDSLAVYFVGRYNAEWSYIYRSSDAGATWTPQLKVSGTYLSTIAAPSDSVAYVFGSNGIAYKTTDGGGTTLSVEASSILRSGISIYPIPATTYIVIDGAFEPGSELTIYDALGRMVKHEHVATFTKPLRIFTGDLPEGYFLLKIDGKSTRLLISR